jgi:hypothetical protein
MRIWLRTWLRVAAGIAVVGSLLWLLAERQISAAALWRSAVWGFAVWVGCGLIWIGLQYGQEREDAHAGSEWRSLETLVSREVSLIQP